MSTAKSFNKKRINEIEVLAESILFSSYGSTEKPKPPINLQKVLDEQGISVRQVLFPDKEIAGAYNKNKKVIYVAENDYFPRQLFTIAHELGHFFLHKDKNTEWFLRQDANALQIGEGGKPVKEKEADWFAASILMPKKLIMDYWSLLGDVQQMANIFGVSQAAMRWRLINLGILRYDDE